MNLATVTVAQYRFQDNPDAERQTGDGSDVLFLQCRQGIVRGSHSG